MKKLLKFLLPSILAVGAVNQTVALPQNAQTYSPVRTVEAVIRTVQLEDDPSPVTAHIHWEKAYRDAMSKQYAPLLLLLQVDSPKRLQAVTAQALKNPRAFPAAIVEDVAGDLFPPLKSPLIKQVDNQVEPLISEYLSAKEKLRSNTFQAEELSRNDDRAMVRVTSTRQGKRESALVPLIKVNNRWLIDAFGVRAP